MEKIGLFGGTFDPPHLGHSVLATAAADQLELDKVLWILTPQPPHKQSRIISPYPLREKLVRLCIAGDARFELSTLEQARPGPHYTLDTVKILKTQMPQRQFYLLLGEDSLLRFHEWHRYQELLAEIFRLAVMRRHGSVYYGDKDQALAPEIKEKLIWIQAPMSDISSGAIRDDMKKGRNIRPFVHEEVFRSLMNRTCENPDAPG